MSWELGGDFMSGMADSIRERRAREVRKEGVVEEAIEEFEEEWPEEEDEWEDEEEWEDDEYEDEEWEEEEEWEDEEWEPKTLIERVLGPLIDFVVDVATMAMIPTALLLVATAYQTTFDVVETALLLFGATTATLMITNTKQKLLRRLLS
jgi:proline/glutamate/leucine-rich protein 1